MNFYLIGIDYKVAPAEARAAAFRRRHDIDLFCRGVLRGQAAALFTCNRVEIYGVAQNVARSVDVFKQIREEFRGIFEQAYFKKHTEEAILHAFRLACGLESQIPFELQIMEQLRSWIMSSHIPKSLRVHWIFVLNLSESIRRVAGVEMMRKDIADFTLEDIRRNLIDLEGKRVCVIGTGKVAELIAQKKFAGSRLYFAARKKHARARKLARRAGGELVSLDDQYSLMEGADVVICATSSPHIVIKPEMVLRVASRRAKQLYIYDLATPRDVHPDVSGIEKVSVCDIENLRASIESYRQKLKPGMDKVEALIDKFLCFNEGGIHEQADQYRHQAELIGV